MVTTAKQRKSPSSIPPEPTNKKDFSRLYKKSSTSTTIPVNVPAMGLDIELEYTPLSADSEALLDQYIIAVIKAKDLDPSDSTIYNDEYWLDVGKRQLLDLALYFKKSASKNKSRSVAEEVADVKSPELVALRDQLKEAIAETELILEPKYDEYEKFTYYMVCNEVAPILHNCLALCFKEIEEPEQLQDQFKFFLMMSILSAGGRVLAI